MNMKTEQRKRERKEVFYCLTLWGFEENEKPAVNSFLLSWNSFSFIFSVPCTYELRGTRYSRITRTDFKMNFFPHSSYDFFEMLQLQIQTLIGVYFVLFLFTYCVVRYNKHNLKFTNKKHGHYYRNACLLTNTPFVINLKKKFKNILL